VTGIQRYTFGQLFLWDGIGLVPVTIGLYAIPELIEMATLLTTLFYLKTTRERWPLMRRVESGRLRGSCSALRSAPGRALSPGPDPRLLGFVA